jgi:hypothetical protein
VNQCAQIIHDLMCAMLQQLLGVALAHHTDLKLKFPGHPAWLPAMASSTTARGGSTPEPLRHHKQYIRRGLPV